MRRTRGAMHHRLAPGFPVILLIAVALLAGSAGPAVPQPRGAYDVIARLVAPSESSVDRMRGRLSGHDASARMTFARAAAGGSARLQTPPSGAGPCSGIALGAACAHLALASPLASYGVAEVRRDGTSSPGQPASSSRAPPIA